jgi:hypothetical protein
MWCDYMYDFNTTKVLCLHMVKYRLRDNQYRQRYYFRIFRKPQGQKEQNRT